MSRGRTRSRRKRRALAGLAVLALGLAVPVAAASAATLDLPVPRVTIYAGDVIEAEQIGQRAFIAHTVARSSVFEDAGAMIGKVARRTLLPGQPVPVNAIREPYLVNVGKASLVVFEAGGLSITMHAVALDNGIAGDAVKLRNPDSGVIIQGVVARDGTVRLGAP